MAISLFYKFSIDTFQPNAITGWCFHRFRPNSIPTLIFRMGETILGECKADQLREDVKELGIHHDGRCGFNFVLPKSIHEYDDEPLHISVAGQKTPLLSLRKKDVGHVLSGRTSLLHQARRIFSRSKKKRDPVFFMHIPKTAGTSFNSSARSHYQQDEILTHIEFYERDEYARIAQSYRFVSGHLRIPEIKKYFAKDTFSLYTLIREPYAHLHSHLNWLRGIGSDKESGFYQGHHPLFRQLADDYGKKDNLNHADLQNLIDTLSGVLRELVDNCQSRHFLDSLPAKIDSSCFAEIEENFSLFRKVGVTEDYTSFVNEFCREHSFSQNKHLSRPLNRARFAPLYDYTDPVVCEIVHPLVEADLLLYEMASQRLKSS